MGGRRCRFIERAPLLSMTWCVCVGIALMFEASGGQAGEQPVRRALPSRVHGCVTDAARAAITRSAIGARAPAMDRVPAADRRELRRGTTAARRRWGGGEDVIVMFGISMAEVAPLSARPPRPPRPRAAPTAPPRRELVDPGGPVQRRAVGRIADCSALEGAARGPEPRLATRTVAIATTLRMEPGAARVTLARLRAARGATGHSRRTAPSSVLPQCLSSSPRGAFDHPWTVRHGARRRTADAVLGAFEHCLPSCRSQPPPPARPPPVHARVTRMTILSKTPPPLTPPLAPPSETRPSMRC